MGDISFRNFILTHSRNEDSVGILWPMLKHSRRVGAEVTANSFKRFKRCSSSRSYPKGDMKLICIIFAFVLGLYYYPLRFCCKHDKVYIIKCTSLSIRKRLIILIEPQANNEIGGNFR